jgi:nucleoside-diphosphate-sugar epimerase
MKVLVTGASGFIGTVLVRRLAHEGIEARGTWWREPAPTTAGVEWRRASPVESVAAWQALLSGCEVAVHLAALAHQAGAAGRGRRDEFWRVNVELTRTLARACRAARTRRLIFVSSIAAMCAESEDPVDESSPCRPIDDYGRSKLEAERALAAELERSAVDWCILRPPLVYGPGNPGNMARLLQLVATGLPLPLGAICNRRSFVFVDNLVDGLLTVIRYPAQIRAAFVVTDGSDFATPELAAALAAASGRSARLLAVPLPFLRLAGRLGDAMSRLLPIKVGIDSYSVDRLTRSLPVNGARFRNFFSWQPPVTVSAALTNTAALYRADCAEPKVNRARRTHDPAGLDGGRAEPDDRSRGA